MATYFDILDSLGWAILHSIWQGGLAWLFCIAVRRGLSGYSPALRCNLQIGVLLVTFLAFIGTFALYMGLAPSEMRLANPLGDQNLTLLSGSDATGSTLTFSPGANGAIVGSSWADTWGGGVISAAWGADRLASVTPFIAAFWVVGFLLTALRYSMGYAAAQKLRTQGVSRPDNIWLRRFSELCVQSGVSRSVRLLISTRVNQPLTLGVLKPIVLVPAGFLTALPSDQVEAILLHELGHIRRYDYALNLIQTAVKTVLFYHPAVHAICRGIDQDREEACDDHAVSFGPDGSVLARGLASLRLLQSQVKAVTRVNQSEFSMAALGKPEKGNPEKSINSPLMRRLTRLAGPSDAVRPEPVMMSALTALLLGSVYLAAPSGARAHPHKAEEPPLRIEAPSPPLQVTPLTASDIMSPPASDVLAGGALTNPSVPVPPVPPVTVPPFEFDEARLNQILAENDRLIAEMNRKIGKYSAKIAKLASQRDFDEDEIEALAEKIEDIADHYQDKIEAREELIEAEVEEALNRWERTFEGQFTAENEAAFEAYEMEMERWAERYEARLEAQVSRLESEADRAADRADMIAERHAEAMANRYAQAYANEAAQKAHEEAMKRQQAQMKAHQKAMRKAEMEMRKAEQLQRAKEQQQRVKEQAQRAAEQQQRAFEQQQRMAERQQRQMERQQREMERQQRQMEQQQREFERQARLHERRNARVEYFRENVVKELVKDGLIRNARETVKLTHINDVMSLNGEAMPKAVRGKYCKMMDEAGFKNHATEITIKPGSMHVSTESHDGDGHKQSTKITYGQFEH